MVETNVSAPMISRTKATFASTLSVPFLAMLLISASSSFSAMYWSARLPNVTGGGRAGSNMWSKKGRSKQSSYRASLRRLNSINPGGRARRTRRRTSRSRYWPRRLTKDPVSGVADPFIAARVGRIAQDAEVLLHLSPYRVPLSGVGNAIVEQTLGGALVHALDVATDEGRGGCG
jgi:hypothetical protein